VYIYVYIYVYILVYRRYMYICVGIKQSVHTYVHVSCYGVATISRLLKITGLFCKRVL